MKLKSVTAEEPASERLLTASAVMAMLLVSEPIKNFAMVSRRLQAIPTAPLRTPYRERTAAFAVLSASLIKSLMSSFVISSIPVYVRSLYRRDYNTAEKNLQFFDGMLWGDNMKKAGKGMLTAPPRRRLCESI